VIGTKITSDKGEVSYIIECETALYLTASMDEYESASGSVEGTSEEEVQQKFFWILLMKLYLQIK